jgi:tRNA threonylcarbamoyladenosine biosynthesis protein TsaB
VPDSVIPRYILAFDTAMGGCSAAVLDTETGQAWSRSEAMGRGQSERLVPMAQEVMAEAGVAMADLGLIVTTIGPGGFTGLRIGLSTARSFGMALGIPVAGVRTTDVLIKSTREKLNDQNRLIAVIETKREDFYVQEDDAEPDLLSADLVLSKYKDNQVTLCGDGILRLKNDIGVVWPETFYVAENSDLPDPVMMARMGADDLKNGRLQPPEPLYLRDADVSVSKRAQRVIAE